MIYYMTIANSVSPNIVVVNMAEFPSFGGVPGGRGGPVYQRSRCGPTTPPKEGNVYILKNVQLVMEALVEPSRGRVEILPVAVEGRHPHFGRIAVEKARTATEILRRPEVLRIIDERIVIKLVPFLEIRGPGNGPGTGMLGQSLRWRQGNGQDRQSEKGKQRAWKHSSAP